MNIKRGKVDEILEGLQEKFDEINELSQDFAYIGNGRAKMKCFRAMKKLEEAMAELKGEGR